MKKKSFFTVMIIPHTEQGPKSIKIPILLIRFISTAFILFLMYAFLWTYNYTLLKNQYDSLKITMDKNQVIIDAYSKDYLTINQDIKSLKEKMIEMQDLEGKIRAEYGFDPTKSYFSKQNQDALTALQEKDKVIASTLKVEETKETVELLKEAVPEKKESLNELIKLIEDKNETLSSVPSIYPTVGRFTSRFGYRKDPFTRRTKFHDGLDIANTYGTPLYATADGVVTFSGKRSGYGNVIQINHGNGYETVYGHNSKNIVKARDFVKKGQLIGYMGSSGRSTGPHLHYEVRINGKPVNPINYLK